MSMRKRYYKELLKSDMIYTKSCSSEENEQYRNIKDKQLPDDIDLAPNTEGTSFIRYTKGELSDEELKIFALAKINSTLNFIKGCAIFFVIIAIVGIILGCVGLFQLNGALHDAYRATSSLFG